MNAAGHPVNVLLVGGVRYAAQGPLMERRGEAERGGDHVGREGKPAGGACGVYAGGRDLVERTAATRMCECGVGYARACRGEGGCRAGPRT